jgi:HD-GYP domain-containing protein (c-di-GMP phosphodiesterase class II)
MTLAAQLAIYRLPDTDLGALANVLEQLGLEATPLNNGGRPGASPTLLLLNGHQRAPQGWEDWAVVLPVDATPEALRSLLQLSLENAVLKAEMKQQRRQFEELNRIGVALSAEHDIDKLQDLILTTCRRLTRADGASLWLVEGEDADRRLRFASTQNHSIDVPYSSFTVPLDEQSMVGYTVISGRSQLVDDAYNLPPGTPFRVATKEFDEQHGYKTESMLCVPLHDHAGEVVGAVQLINAKRHAETKLSAERVTDEIVPFRREDLSLIESIASQAAVEGFVKASVTAIESRDPTTYGHSGRVAALTVGLAEAVSTIATGIYKELMFSPDQLKELRYAALLHDFGKVGVREHVLVKEKKLYPSQLDLIRARFEFVRRSIQLERTADKLDLALTGSVGPATYDEIDRRLAAELAQLQEWLNAVLEANEPTMLEQDKASMLEFLAGREYTDVDGRTHPLLEPEELHLLSIRRGTLDEHERLEIESHVTHSFRFLTRIPWTPAMRNIPVIAYGHHEKLDGSGYPRRLKGPEIPLQARMMTISDIFDALTATDRPYKRAVPVERALTILEGEASENKLDADLLDVFIAKRVYTLAASYRPDQQLMLGGPSR